MHTNLKKGSHSNLKASNSASKPSSKEEEKKNYNLASFSLLDIIAHIKTSELVLTHSFIHASRCNEPQTNLITNHKYSYIIISEMCTKAAQLLANAVHDRLLVI